MIDRSNQVRRLERREFAAALKKGLGRAARHVSLYGLDDVVDLVLDACLHDQRYDAQAEPSRVGWLFTMFAESDQYPMFQEAILEHAKTETKTWNALQLLGLAKEMAARGDEQARQALGERVRDGASRSDTADDWVGADLWIELEGPKGLLELARIYGHRLLANPEDLVPDDIFQGDERAPEHRETLRQHAEIEPEIKAYSDYLEARGVWNEAAKPIDGEAAAARNREEARRQYDVSRIVADARNHAGEYPGRYYRFGRFAAPDELQAIYEHLLVEPDAAARLRLLCVFRRAPLPRLEDVVFTWASGADEALRTAAIAALSNSGDARVHELARAKVQAGELLGADSEALNLFKNTYIPPDASLISKALLGLGPDADAEHSLGFSLTDLAEQYPGVELAPALQWVYEKTPCANCRRRAVVQLEARHRFNAEVWHECLLDASEDIRSFAENHPTDQPVEPSAVNG